MTDTTTNSMLAELVGKSRVVEFHFDGEVTRTVELQTPTIADVQPLIEQMRANAKDESKLDGYELTERWENIIIPALRLTLPKSEKVDQYDDDQLRLVVRRSGGIFGKLSIAVLQMCGLATPIVVPADGKGVAKPQAEDIDPTPF